MKLHEKIEASLTKGMLINFDLDGRKIEYWASSYSGKEIVKVDGELIAQTRNYKLSSCHQFKVDKKQCEVVVNARSAFKGSFTIEFRVDQKLHTSYKIRYGKISKTPLVARFTPVIVGATVGWFYAADVLALWQGLVISGCGIALPMMLFRTEGWQCEQLA